MLTTWPAASGPELAVAFDRGRAIRVLISAAWFGESNRMRHLTVEVMRRLDQSGIDSFLPDMPGQNESVVPLVHQTVTDWAKSMADAATFFGATHCLAVRAGGVIAPDLPGWRYAPCKPSSQLKTMVRARVMVAKEAGIAETSADLLAAGQNTGLELAGYVLGPGMVADLTTAEMPPSEKCSVIEQRDIPGSGLWLRSEPDFDAAQADALAERILEDCTI